MQTRNNPRYNCLQPQPDEIEVIAAQLGDEHPEWTRARCEQRAHVVWYLKVVDTSSYPAF